MLHYRFPHTQFSTLLVLTLLTLHLSACHHAKLASESKKPQDVSSAAKPLIDDFDQFLADVVSEAKGAAALPTIHQASGVKNNRKKKKKRSKKPGKNKQEQVPKISTAERFASLAAEVHDYCNFYEETIRTRGGNLTLPTNRIEEVKAVPEEQRYEKSVEIMCENAKELLKLTDSLLEERISIDEYVQKLVGYRKSTIVNRNSLIEKTIHRALMMVSPGDEELFRLLIKPDFSQEDVQKHDQERLDAVRRHELYDLLIQNIFQKVQKGELSAQTENYLRASVDLLPLLRGDQEVATDLDGGTCYALIKHLLEPYMKQYPQLESWDYNIRREIAEACCDPEKWKKGHQDTFGKEQKSYQEQFEDSENSWKHKNCALANVLTRMMEHEHLKKDKQKRIEQIAKRLEAFIRVEETQKRRRKGKTVTTYIVKSTWRECGERIIDTLPPIGKKRPSLSAPVPEQEVTSKNVPAPPVPSAPTPVLSPAAPKNTPVPPLSVPEPLPDVAATPRIVPQQLIEVPSPTAAPELPPTVTPKPSSTVRKSESTLALKKELSPAQDKALLENFLKNWALPPNVRRFRRDLLLRSYPVGTYTVNGNSSKKTLRTLFGGISKGATKVSYEQIKALWENIKHTENASIKCSIRKTGGSHRTFLDPQGNVVVKTWKLHGRDRYGPMTSKLFQAALLHMGVRPDNWGEAITSGKEKHR